MTEIKIAVKDNNAILLRAIDLVAGTVGQKGVLYCDDNWSVYNKTISYKVGTTVLGTYKIDSNTFTIPAQILATAGLPLEIGITGRSTDNSIIIPTKWCYIGMIQNGTLSNGIGNNIQDDEIIYDGGGVSSNSKNKAVYEGGGV